MKKRVIPPAKLLLRLKYQIAALVDCRERLDRFTHEATLGQLEQLNADLKPVALALIEIANRI